MSGLIIRGRVLKYGANINTDHISPASYIGFPKDIAIAHAMEGVDPAFPSKVRQGDILVAGHNFGSGSSRESAPWVLRESGIAAVVSPLFARIFYRNAINIGLPALTVANVENINEGDDLEIYLSDGKIQNLKTGESFICDKFSKEVMQLLQNGGVVASLEKRFLKHGSL